MPAASTAEREPSLSFLNVAAPFGVLPYATAPSADVPQTS
jgi:hypothetical protein